MTTERLWRCETCGKWSHAKRQPRKHKRWVRDLSAPLYGDSGDLAGYDGDFVDCGPFSGWVATKILRGEA